jgi:hypothetical protein
MLYPLLPSTKLTAGESNVNRTALVPTNDATEIEGTAVAIDAAARHCTVVPLDHDVVVHCTSSAIPVGVCDA